MTEREEKGKGERGRDSENEEGGDRMKGNYDGLERERRDGKEREGKRKEKERGER